MLLSTKKDDSVVLLLSIQSSIVRATLVRAKKSELPFVLFNHNQDIAYRASANAASITTSALKAVSEAIAVAAKEFHKMSSNGSVLPKKVSEAHYVLSSPWIMSHARTISQAFSRPTIVTRKTMMDIISRERAEYMQKRSGSLEMIEEKIFDIRLNGYDIEDWQGKSADSLQVSFAESVAETGVIKQFRDICERGIRTKRISFHSSLLLEHIGVQAIMPHEMNYVLAHVHGELTDVAIVENRMGTLFGSFPLGINTVTRAISRSLGVSSQIADSLIALCVGGCLDQALERKAIAAVEKAADDWTLEFGKLLKQSSYVGKLPRSIFLTARVHEDFFIGSFKRAYQNNEIRPVVMEDLKTKVAFGQGVESLALVAMYVIALNSI